MSSSLARTSLRKAPTLDLRPELQFPTFDETTVQRLTELAAAIDGARPGEWEKELAEFNQLAGTNCNVSEFQGIYGGMEHETWVRAMLATQHAGTAIDLSPEECLELITRLMKSDGAEHELIFWVNVLKTNLDPRISDLIYWPGEYFGDGDNSRQLTPELVLETALKSGS